MNSTMILRSPSLAAGGPVHVVRLYEAEPYARGGFARTGKARAITLHLSTPEIRQIRAKWGKPRRNAKTGMDEYAFPRDALRGMSRFASGGQVGYSPPPLLSGATQQNDEALRRRNPVEIKDYYTYGAGPEHQFFEQNVAPGQPDFPHLPATPTTGPATKGGGSNWGDIVGLGAVARGGAALANAMGYDNALTQGAATLGNAATGNILGAAKSGLKLYGTLTQPSMADYASGTALDDALTGAGFTGAGGPPPIEFDAAGNAIEPAGLDGATKSGMTAGRALGGVGGALNVYSGLKEGGTEGYLNAAKGTAQLANAAGYGGSLASNAIPVLGLATGAYQAHKAIQAGDTKNAAMAGAMAGASFGPVGMVIGAALGAIGGAMNKDYAEEKVRDSYYNLLDPKQGNWDTSQQVSPQDFYKAVAGEFRGKRSAFAPRSSGKYGQKDEDKFIADMASQINDAYSRGVIGKGATAQDVMAKVIDPWFQRDFGGWRTDIPQDWQSDQRAMTTDLVNRYIHGSPVDWGVLTNSQSEFPVAKYLGLAQGGLAASERYVRGPGTGRSDSIPAQLSDGEYVLTAEDVALLGDGSNEAGARRLDEFRRELRKHKGGALARGKISPNAKSPMQYMRGR